MGRATINCSDEYGLMTIAHERLFTDDQLAAMARPPADVLEGLLADRTADGTVDGIGAFAASIERSWQGAIVGYHDWIAHTQGYLFERHGAAALARLVPVTGRLLAIHPDRDLAGGGGDPSAPPVPETLAALGTAGEIDAVRSGFDSWQDEQRRVHDLLRDWVSVLLSHVYESYGVDALESAIRYAGERTLLAWMPSDIARPPAKRLTSWARMLHGHFTSFSLEEDDEKFTIVQDPCGSCTRQIQQGRYEPPLCLAVIREPHLVSWGRGDTPVYRSHVPVMHQLMPGEAIGVPWPVNLCPPGLGTGPCRILLYKDPLNPVAAEWFKSAPTGRP
jgi:hypothetical protein